MSHYPTVTITIRREARKALDRLPRTARERIEAAISALPDGDVKRLEERPDFRLRVGGWRIIYRVDGNGNGDREEGF